MLKRIICITICIQLKQIVIVYSKGIDKTDTRCPCMPFLVKVKTLQFHISNRQCRFHSLNIRLIMFSSIKNIQLIRMPFYTINLGSGIHTPARNIIMPGIHCHTCRLLLIIIVIVIKDPTIVIIRMKHLHCVLNAIRTISHYHSSIFYSFVLSVLTRY